MPATTEPEFMQIERAFARYLRDPENHPPPLDVDDRRLAVYRHAIFANIDRLMRDNYPRVRAVIDDDRWRAMVRDYLTRHVSLTNAFVELPREFLAYLEHERDDVADPPFLRELAHFDWLETLVGADQNPVEPDAADARGDVLDGVLVVNRTVRLVTYRYPVHAIDATFQPTDPPASATRIAAFRDRAGSYAFLDLSPAAARVLELAMARPDTGRHILACIARELGQDDVEAMTDAGGTILARMTARGAILGTRRA